VSRSARRVANIAWCLVAALGLWSGASAGCLEPIDSKPPPLPQYPSAWELRPVRESLQKVKSATVYVVDPALQSVTVSAGKDSAGYVAGFRMLASVKVARKSWLDSLSAVLSNPESYLREERLCISLQHYVIRLHCGTRDSLTVWAGTGCSFLEVDLSNGKGVGGWLEHGCEVMADLMRSTRVDSLSALSKL